jgi:hypothetical protein
VGAVHCHKRFGAVQKVQRALVQYTPAGAGAIRAGRPCGSTGLTVTEVAATQTSSEHRQWWMIRTPSLLCGDSSYRVSVMRQQELACAEFMNGSSNLFAPFAPCAIQQLSRLDALLAAVHAGWQEAVLASIHSSCGGVPLSPLRSVSVLGLRHIDRCQLVIDRRELLLEVIIVVAARAAARAHRVGGLHLC